jgi:hypothetical protein
MALEKRQRIQCPDCYQCQGCSKSRCRACMKGDKGGQPCGLASGFTYGEYLEWKRKKEET